jgi:hypothetical protein
MEGLDQQVLDLIMGQLPHEDKMRLRQASTALRLASDRDGTVIKHICRNGGPYKRALSLRGRYLRFCKGACPQLFGDERRRVLTRLNILGVITEWQMRAKKVKRWARKRALFARKRAELDPKQYERWSRKMESSAKRAAAVAKRRGTNHLHDRSS